MPRFSLIDSCDTFGVNAAADHDQEWEPATPDPQYTFPHVMGFTRVPLPLHASLLLGKPQPNLDDEYSSTPLSPATTFAASPIVSYNTASSFPPKPRAYSAVYPIQPFRIVDTPSEDEEDEDDSSEGSRSNPSPELHPQSRFTECLSSSSISLPLSEITAEFMWPYDGMDLHEYHRHDPRGQFSVAPTPTPSPETRRQAFKRVLMGRVKALFKRRQKEEDDRMPNSMIPHPMWDLPYRSDRDSIHSNETDGDVEVYLQDRSNNQSEESFVISNFSLDSEAESQLFRAWHGPSYSTLLRRLDDVEATGHHRICDGCSRWFDSSAEVLGSARQWID